MILAFFCFVNFNAQSQCSIDAKPDVCFGDIAFFKMNIPSGKTISTIKWKFGDGKESSSKDGSNIYAAVGSFTVSCDVVFSDASSCNASHKIEVLALPNANFVDVSGVQYICTKKSSLCFQNNCTPAQLSRPIDKIFAVWGDGDLDAFTNGSFPAKICHDYTNAGKYKLRLEISDTRGCKNRFNSNIEVFEGVRAQVMQTPNTLCDKTGICFKNVTVGKTPFPSLKWIVDNKDLGYKGDLCFLIYKDTNLDIKFTVNSLNYKCPDTFKVKLVVKKELNVLKLTFNKKKLCLSESEQLIVKLLNANKPVEVRWFINNKLVQIQEDTFIIMNPRPLDLNPGKYEIKVDASLTDGRICTIRDSIEILGPKAKLTAWNNFQCGTHKKVYFIDSTRFSSGRTRWLWETPQFASGNCTIWRARNQNKYTNCTFTRDKWGKHLYDDTFIGEVKVTVYDSATGCQNEEYLPINYQRCPFQDVAGDVVTCLGDTFIPLVKNYFNPTYFSLDSGKTWRNFPDLLAPPFKPGRYPLMIIKPRNYPVEARDFGADSFEVVNTPVIMDTLLMGFKVLVLEKLTLPVGNIYSRGCKSKCEVVMELSKYKFKKDDRLFVNWGSGAESIEFQRDTLIDTLVFPMGKPGSGEVSLLYSRPGYCSFSYTGPTIRCGQEVLLFGDTLACYGNTLCASVVVKYIGFQAPVWNMNSPPKPYKFLLDSVELKNKNRICKKVNDIKTMPIRFIIEDGPFCSDTTYSSVKIQRVQPAFKDISRYSYCSDIKQLFDSSIVSGSGNLSDVEYFWSFNFGRNISTKKDPYQVFNSSGGNSVKHWVKSSYGCVDSVEVNMIIEGSKPNFVLPDTIGCAPFTAKFVNFSKDCKYYIWEFGDQSNSTASTDSLKDQFFKYYLPGVYYPFLTGIDTVFNKITGEAYNCIVRFPEDPDTIRKITVLQTLKTKIEGPDTVCANQKFTVKSLTKPDSIFDEWNINGNNTKEKAGKSYTLSFDTGKYRITLLPDYVPVLGQPKCADTAIKTIVVLGVTADFDMFRKDSLANFTFINKSSTSAVKFLWNFGDPDGKNNTSTDKNTEHDYFPSSGEITACLIAKNAFGCADTICKKFNQPYVEKILMANIFSPGKDGLNDAFDIIIVGEYQYHLRIINRYGAVVFETQKDGQGYKDANNWNGKVNNTGSDCPEGMYFYEFNYSFLREPKNIKTIKGGVQLVR